MGVAIYRIWRECNRVVRRIWIDGRHDGIDQSANSYWRNDIIAELDLPQLLFILGHTDQCVSGVRDCFYFVMVIFDVVVVPEKDIPKSVTEAFGL